MNEGSEKFEFEHICPRNCFSNCNIVSTVENNRIVKVRGDRRHSYSNGKLCAKGYSYVERNYHAERLKYPYYQKVKGSGKFQQITWKKAFDIISCEMMNIHRNYGHFLPLALYKGSGNLGVHHYVTDHFFSSFGETTRIKGSSNPTTGFEAIQYGTGVVKMSDPSTIKEASMIMIWGSNPAVTNIHLIPFIMEAKAKGAKLVVIDPIYTQTAELADLYIQLRPSTDGALANLLTKELIEDDCYAKEFVENHSYGSHEFFESVRRIHKHDLLQTCGIAEEAIDILVNWLKDADAVSYLLGIGLQKHTNGGQNIRAIEALAAVHGDIGKKGGGLFSRRTDTNLLFTNQQLGMDQKSRIININEQNTPSSNLTTPIEMMWITGANPLVQEPNSQFMTNFMKNIPFVVTVDLFMTPTAKHSNLVLPTTSHFEEVDIVTSHWHKTAGRNEKAIKPYYESLSEWNIMKELAIRLKEYLPNQCTFPVHSNEEDYLDSQFNKKVFDRYFIQNLSDIKDKGTNSRPTRTVWEKGKFATNTGLYHFFSSEAEENNHPPMPIFIEGLSPTTEYPFWLITPHNPYAFNSQFHFLHLSEEDEAYIEIHPEIAAKLSIYEGEVIKIYNDQDHIEIKVVFSRKVPKDILVIYQGWYPDSDLYVNQLVPTLSTDMGEKITGTKGTAFYDTFVNVSKL